MSSKDNNKSGVENGGDKKEVDIYRDTPLRLLGYANEVGEAFRALVHVWAVRGSYVVASSYVLADTLDKAKKEKRRYELAGEEVPMGRVAAVSADTLIWQALASVIVPGFTINRICWATGLMLARTIPRVALTTRKWMTTGVGMGAIPLIFQPIDHGVHVAMDYTLRPVYGVKVDHHKVE